MLTRTRSALLGITVICIVGVLSLPVERSGTLPDNYQAEILGPFCENLAQEIASAARQMLHAWRLVFDHPRNGKRLIMVASPPADMRNLVSVLRT